MKFTTHLALESQPARLFERVSYAASSGSKTGFSPSMMPCSKETYTQVAHWQHVS